MQLLKKIHLYDYTVNHILFIKIIFKYIRRIITFRTKVDNLIYSIKNYINFIKFNNLPNVCLFKRRVVKNLGENIDIRLDQILSNIEGKNNLLKIDIEGNEYEIIDDILFNSSIINMMVIEFHWINDKNQIFIDSIKKLKKKFDIIHIHPNNYRQKKAHEDFFDVVEITLVNKDINQFNKEFRYNFPIKDLDFECFPNHKKIEFSFNKNS